MADIIHLDLRRKNIPLKDLTDPCSDCNNQPKCRTTCQRAITWWAKFTEKFKRQNVINQLDR